MKKRLSAKAIRILRKVEKHILEEPRRFMMSDWIEKQGDEGDHAIHGKAFPKCGTVACIGGWAELLSSERFVGDRVRSVAEMLGLNASMESRLFYQGNWPEPFASDFKEKGTLRDAKVAVARIEHFVATDGEE